LKGVWKAWNNSEVNVVGAYLSAGEIEGSKLQGANLVQDTAKLSLHGFPFFLWQQPHYLKDICIACLL
jgi:hypothetical protein